MTVFRGFIGGSYENRSLNVDVQRTVNLYPEVVESRTGKNVVALQGTPGLKAFCDTSNAMPVRALEFAGNRLLAVVGGTLYKISSAGTATSLGSVGPGTDPVTIQYDGTRWFIVNNARGFVLTGDTLAEVTDPDWPGANLAAFLDGYHIVIQPNTQKVFVSTLLDGSAWAALDFGSAEADGEDALSVLSDHRELWVFGRNMTEVWYNSGNADFPLQPIRGAEMETGILAVWSAAKIDNSIFWMGGDDRGSGIVYRAQGHTPLRVSTHAVEKAIQGYATKSDAVGFTYHQEGHAFYCLYFPTADRTWVYDASTQLWHERCRWDSTLGGTTLAWRARCHAHAFGKHLVGDISNGKIHELDLDTYDEDGSAMVAMRRCPHLSKEQERLFYSWLQVDCEAGVGLDGSGNGTDPKLMMRFSNDGGRKWSNRREVAMGKKGETNQRAVFRRLGQGRDRVFEVSISDAVKRSMVAAYLGVSAEG